MKIDLLLDRDIKVFIFLNNFIFYSVNPNKM